MRGQLPFGFERFESDTLYLERGTAGGIARTATFSKDGRYRYELTRAWPLASINDASRQHARIQWSDHHPIGVFIGANPSKAGAVDDDQTVKKYTGFAQRFGWAGFVALNLDAFIATRPEDLPTESTSAAGPLGDAFLWWRCSIGGCSADPPIGGSLPRDEHPIVLAWGYRSPDRYERAREVVSFLMTPGRRLFCLGTTADGQPLHASRLSYAAELEPWPPRPVDREAPTKTRRRTV